VARTVVVYRAMNERSWYRFGAGSYGFGATPFFENVNYGWYMPHGLHTPAAWVGMFARRYMHTYGATSEDFGRISVAARDFAATNPQAFFHGKPITLEDHQNSRWICEPLRLLDCCQESDGAVAMVITSVERARDLKQKPVVIKAAAQGISEGQQIMTSFYRDDITGLPEMGLVARQVWAQSGLAPADIQTAVIYDHFTPFVLPQLEEFGFVGRGEAKDFVRAGHHTRGGLLPINTHGGQLGEAYIHGMNGIAEGVRQVRGSAVNQVEGVHNVLVTAGTGVPTSALILGDA
jgi:acetyl-CoA acetyltransferase